MLHYCSEKQISAVLFNYLSISFCFMLTQRDLIQVFADLVLFEIYNCHPHSLEQFMHNSFN